jgi:hypothetical protein
MKLIIAGSRDFFDSQLVRKELHDFCDCYDVAYSDLTIFSGGCRGADEVGERWAREFNVPVKVFKAQWAMHGGGAGPIRNKLMASKADACIVFWNGKSYGTKSMITEAKMKNLILKVVNY